MIQGDESYSLKIPSKRLRFKMILIASSKKEKETNKLGKDAIKSILIIKHWEDCKECRKLSIAWFDSFDMVSIMQKISWHNQVITIECKRPK